MSAPAPSRRALPEPAFARLSQTLSAANARHHALAAAFAPKRTWHAKKRAAKLRLGVDIVKAVNCPHNRVSVVPLPIVEQELVPEVLAPPPAVSLAYRPRPAQKPTRLNVHGSMFTTVSLVSPAVASARGTETGAQGALCGVLPWNAYNTLAHPSFLVATRRAPAPIVPVEAIMYTSDDDLEDFELLYPEDEESSSSSSSAASSGPTTPSSDVEMRSASSSSSAGKRKYTDEEDATRLLPVVFEKRPKYERKSWTRPVTALAPAPRGRKIL